MKEFRIECDECEEESVVRADAEVQFCPCCGRRASSTMLEEELDFGDEDDY